MIADRFVVATGVLLHWLKCVQRQAGGRAEAAERSTSANALMAA
jgi:hypothetical protein